MDIPKPCDTCKHVVCEDDPLATAWCEYNWEMGGTCERWEDWEK